MPVKRLDPAQQLLVVPERDEDLGIVSDGRLENGERALGDFVLFELTNLELGEFGLGKVEELAGAIADRDERMGSGRRLKGVKRERERKVGEGL